MSRVNESRDAQRLQEQRQSEKKQGEKSKREGQEFSKMVSSRQENTGKANARQQVAQGKHTGQKAAAGNRLMARQGIQQNSFAQQLQQKGSQSLGTKQTAVESRKNESEETQRGGEEKSTKNDKARLTGQDDKLAAISRDDRKGGGGAGGGGGSGGKEFGGNQQEGPMGSAVGTSQAEGAQTPATQAAAAAQAPRLPQHLLQEIVKRVLIGVNTEGLKEMHIEFNEGVLGGTRLQLTADGGKIKATFSTPDKNIGRLIKASEGALSRAFAHKGLSLERLAIEEG